MTPENLLSRVRRNNDWLAQCENLYRQQQKRDGQTAREIREVAGLSLREVARRMDVSAPFLSDLERGNRNWTTETLNKWKEALTK